jgi:hypothetical protein
VYGCQDGAYRGSQRGALEKGEVQGLRRISLLLSDALVVMLLAIAGLAEAPATVIPNALAQYGAGQQYSAGGEYAPSSADQYGTVPTCEQEALNALSSPNLESNSQTANRKLLSEFVKCGGTIASLPQESFTTLLRQGNIELDVVGSGWVACPRGDKTHCSSEPNFIG